MAVFGPVPKRDDERIRRNKPDEPTTVIQMIGQVGPPSLGIADPHPLVREMYDSLAESGQAKYFEPSDWQFAQFTMVFVNDLLKTSRPSAVMLQTVNSMLADLLFTEAQRRRVRMEVERNDNTEGGKVLDVADIFRERFLKSVA